MEVEDPVVFVHSLTMSATSTAGGHDVALTLAFTSIGQSVAWSLRSFSLA